GRGEQTPRRLPVLLRRLRTKLPEANAESRSPKGASGPGAGRPGECPLDGLLPRLLPLPLERAEGRGRMPGLLVVRPAGVGPPEKEGRDGVGGGPRRRLEGPPGAVQPGGLLRPPPRHRVSPRPRVRVQHWG